MLELQTRIKRQIEIIGLAIEPKGVLRPMDLAEMYHCEELTIKRDLSDLRAHGIDIHSERTNGIQLASPLDAVRVRELIVQYLGICSAEDTVDKATALLVNRRKEKALSMIVLLQKCIEAHRTVVFDYEKEAANIEHDREVCPLLLFQSEGYWRLLALHDERIKQYHLDKLRTLHPTERTFVPIPREQIAEMFRFSFRSWIGTDKHHVRIKLNSVWANRIKPRQLMESQFLSENPDGSVILETTVNSLEEIASWVVSRGEGVTVLEPEELRKKVIELAKGALKNYDTDQIPR